MVKKETIARAAFGAVLILILLAIAVSYSAFDANFGIDTSVMSMSNISRRARSQIALKRAKYPGLTDAIGNRSADTNSRPS